MDEDEYSSGSDESDEDFCPNNDADSNIPSEDESDNEGEDFGKDDEKVNKKKVTSNSNQPATKRVSRHAEDTKIEKDELESDEDEEDKKRSDSLWADFLGDGSASTTSTVTKSANKSPIGSSSSLVPKTRNNSLNKASVSALEKPKVPEKPNTSKVAPDILEFAGEIVTIPDQKAHQSDASSQRKPPPKLGLGIRGLPLKRPAVGGMSSILGQIGKKNKLSVLEKSKMDWNSFKDNEGINEELETFNKGRNGYLERQDFLERTDHRQFEIEKNLRLTKKK